MQTHVLTRVHSPSATSLLPLYSHKLMLIHLLIHIVGPQSFDMSRGSLPPDRSSINIEMFAPPTGVVTPSSVNQFVLSSGQPMAMQLDAALMTMFGLSKEQEEEIFLLTHEAQMLGLRLTHAILSSCPTKRHCSIWESKPLGMRKLPVGALTMLPAYYSMIKSEGEGALVKKLNESIDRLREEAGKAWLDTNPILIHHAL